MKVYLWLALVVIVLTALLTPLLWGLGRDVVLIEILRMAWVVDRLSGSLPQEPFWIAFLFVAALVAALSLVPRPGKGDPALQPPPRAEGQLADLALLIRRAGRRPYFRRRLVQRLSYLGREVFAHRQEAVSEPGNRSKPAGKTSHLQPGGARATRRHPESKVEGPWPPNASLQQALDRLRAEPDAVHGPVDPAVELFIQFLEEQLEVSDAPCHRPGR